MNYKKYFVEFLVVSCLMCAGLFYFLKLPLQDALMIGSVAALLTVVNKYYLDKKALKSKK